MTFGTRTSEVIIWLFLAAPIGLVWLASAAASDRAETLRAGMAAIGAPRPDAPDAWRAEITAIIEQSQRGTTPMMLAFWCGASLLALSAAGLVVMIVSKRVPPIGETDRGARRIAFRPWFAAVVACLILTMTGVHILHTLGIARSLGGDVPRPDLESLVGATGAALPPIPEAWEAPTHRTGPSGPDWISIVGAISGYGPLVAGILLLALVMAWPRAVVNRTLAK